MTLRWLDNATQDLVDEFWARCGEVEPFPRTLERPLALALPLALVKVPDLQLSRIEAWLNRRRVPFSFRCSNRAVRGCLVAYAGQGVIFLDGADPADEQRFSLAHEIGHFLVDYWRPRQTTIFKLGPGIAEVLDGARPATLAERVHAILGACPVGVHINLMEREQRDDDLSGTLESVEDRADRVALALLAPPEQVLGQRSPERSSFEERQVAVRESLIYQFGLPPNIANVYGRALLNAIGRGPSFLEQLGLR